MGEHDVMTGLDQSCDVLSDGPHGSDLMVGVGRAVGSGHRIAAKGQEYAHAG
ncbi:hypothetical protein GCM10027053_16160 [Intrasporangium mesophilum]